MTVLIWRKKKKWKGEKSEILLLYLKNHWETEMSPKHSSIEQRHFWDSNTLKIDKYTSYLEKTKESQTDYPIFKGTNAEGLSGLLIVFSTGGIQTVCSLRMPSEQLLVLS